MPSNLARICQPFKEPALVGLMRDLPEFTPFLRIVKGVISNGSNSNPLAHSYVKKHRWIFRSKLGRFGLTVRDTSRRSRYATFATGLQALQS